MKKIIFTAAIALLATFEMSGQQWSGSNNTTGNIERTGRVTIVSNDLSLYGTGNTSLGWDASTKFTSGSNQIAHYGMTKLINNQVALSSWNGLYFFTNNEANARMSILRNGNVGIGSLNPDERLTVKGIIHAEEVRVDLNVPADYVFESYYTGVSELKPEYKMPTLEEVEAYTKANNHLPEMPSAQEIQEDGLYLSKMTNLLLQKIEELTLYTIEQEKRIKALEEQLKK
jgi:hypothetical protein